MPREISISKEARGYLKSNTRQFWTCIDLQRYVFVRVLYTILLAPENMFSRKFEEKVVKHVNSVELGK